MGFGLGLDRPARRQPLVNDEDVTDFGLRRFTLKRAGAARTLVVTPADTPDFVRLAEVSTWAQRQEHAQKLVRFRDPSGSTAPGMLYAQRSPLGDARDLFCHVARTALSLDADLPHANEDVTTFEGYRLIVHIGDTALARVMLSGLMTRRTPDPRVADWDGELDSLDADGYAHLCIAQSTLTHLFLVGGSAYGTFFAVSQFLREVVGVEWLFPGVLGEVIPRADVIDSGRVVNQIDEPTVRIRTMGVLTTGADAHEVAERDEIRSWMLRNRVRPGVDRGTILQHAEGAMGLPRDWDCASWRSDTEQDFYRSLLQPESRMAVGHMMTRYLSPIDPPLDLSPSASTEPRFNHPWTRDMYPDLRPRLPGRSTRAGSGVLAAVGPLDPAARATRARIDSLCGRVAKYVPVSEVGSGYGVGSDSDPAYYLTSATMNVGGESELRFTAAIKREAASGATFLRAIPSSRRERIERRNWPEDLWHPCIFEHALSTARVGRLHATHPSSAIDIANQLDAVRMGRDTHAAIERAFNIAFDDASRWCNCDGCVRADERGGPNALLMLWFGRLIAQDFEALDVFDVRFNPHRVAEGLSRDENPFRRLDNDALSWRGVLHSRGYVSWRSRRVLALCNRIATALRENASARPDRIDWASHTVLALYAYNQCSAAPMFSPRDAPESPPPEDIALTEQADPLLMVFVAETRDTAEYAKPYPTQEGASEAYQRLTQWPQQFNHDRWASIASRTGMYEYLVHDGFETPRLYSRRLLQALSTGVQRFHVKGFVSETGAAWGLSGPALWETAEMLWRVPEDGTPLDLDALRQRFCDKAFGPAGSWMKRYFDQCEEAWADTRDGELAYRDGSMVGVVQPDVRVKYDQANGYFGQGFAGRQGVLSQLRGLFRWIDRPADLTVSMAFTGDDAVNENILWGMLPGNTSTGAPRVNVMWALLQQALAAVSDGGHADARERVQLVRRCFGFTRYLARWYLPFHLAFQEVYKMNTMNTTTGAAFVGGVVSLQSMFQESIGMDRGWILRRYESIATTDVLASRSTVLRGMLRSRIGVPARPGIRVLRQWVHQYLARTDLDEDGSLGLGDLGFGFSVDPATAMSGGMEAFPRRNDLHAAEHQKYRLAGAHWPTILTYMNWWNDVLATTGPLDNLGVSIANYSGSGSVDGAPIESWWIFAEIKKMAKIVLLYCPGLVPAGFSEGAMEQAIRQG